MPLQITSQTDLASLGRTASIDPLFSSNGEIGRRARLRIWFRKECGFKSLFEHFLIWENCLPSSGHAWHRSGMENLPQIIDHPHFHGLIPKRDGDEPGL